MAVKVNLERILKERNITLTELSSAIDISIVNLSRLKTGNIKAIRFSTLEKICNFLDCKPGEILDLEKDDFLTKN